jgi:hypothetical protein
MWSRTELISIKGESWFLKMPVHQRQNNLRVVVQLNSHNAEVVRRRVSDDVGKIAIQRQKNRAQFLSLGDYRRVKRADGEHLPQQSHLVAAAA